MFRKIVILSVVLSYVSNSIIYVTPALAGGAITKYSREEDDDDHQDPKSSTELKVPANQVVDQLPYELHADILDQLDFKDLLALGITSRCFADNGQEYLNRTHSLIQKEHFQLVNKLKSLNFLRAESPFRVSYDSMMGRYFGNKSYRLAYNEFARTKLASLDPGFEAALRRLMSLFVNTSFTHVSFPRTDAYQRVFEYNNILRNSYLHAETAVVLNGETCRGRMECGGSMTASLAFLGLMSSIWGGVFLLRGNHEAHYIYALGLGIVLLITSGVVLVKTIKYSEQMKEVERTATMNLRNVEEGRRALVNSSIPAYEPLQSASEVTPILANAAIEPNIWEKELLRSSPNARQMIQSVAELPEIRLLFTFAGIRMNP